jgi:hypothetical protein
MRDDFSVSVKDELAKRVGYACSNPRCRRPTSGPQSTPLGTVNIGVAAHITAASPGGPRYDSSLSTAQRTSAENGIWLCQTCAKLIDSDQSGFTPARLAEWKADTESAAALALSERRSPPSRSEGVFHEAKRLMPALIAEMRSDVQGDATELVREFCVLQSPNHAYGWSKPHFRYDGESFPDLALQIDWLEEMGLVEDVTTGNLPKFRLKPDFVDWLRTSG